MARTPREQTFQVVPLAVPSATAIQVSASININNLIQSLAICNFSANANSVFLGQNNAVTTTSGYEIPPGTGPIFQIQQERELYELEVPLENLVQLANCGVPSTSVDIPMIVWNPSNMWLIAATAPTNVSITIFNNVYS
jgi:hypothetical protein